MGVKAHCVVEIRRPTEAVDGFGQTSGGDTTIYTVPCRVETLSGRELVQARTVFELASHRVTKLYLDPAKRLKAKDYLLLNGRRLDIGFLNDLRQTGVEWELLCNEQM